MALKRKSSLLLGAVALAGAVCLPAASATTFNLNAINVPPTPSTQPSLAKSVDGGVSFIDNITFPLHKTADASNALSSNAEVGAGSFAQFASGVKPTSVTLYSVSSKGLGTKITALNMVSSSAVGAGASNSAGSLSTLLAPPAVPETEQWAMILVGAGLVSYQVRRKQKELSHSTSA